MNSDFAIILPCSEQVKYPRHIPLAWLYVVKIAEAQRIRAKHFLVQHKSGLLHLVLGRVHGDGEQVELDLDVIPVGAP